MNGRLTLKLQELQNRPWWHKLKNEFDEKDTADHARWLELNQVIMSYANMFVKGDKAVMHHFKSKTFEIVEVTRSVEQVFATLGVRDHIGVHSNGQDIITHANNLETYDTNYMLPPELGITQ